MTEDDEAIELGLANTSESWKRALLISAKTSGARERLILAVAVASLVVALTTLIVTLLK